MSRATEEQLDLIEASAGDGHWCLMPDFRAALRALLAERVELLKDRERIERLLNNTEAGRSVKEMLACGTEAIDAALPKSEPSPFPPRL